MFFRSKFVASFLPALENIRQKARTCLFLLWWCRLGGRGVKKGGRHTHTSVARGEGGLVVQLTHTPTSVRGGGKWWEGERERRVGTLHRKLCRATVNSDRSDAVPTPLYHQHSGPSVGPCRSSVVCCCCHCRICQVNNQRSRQIDACLLLLQWGKKKETGASLVVRRPLFCIFARQHRTAAPRRIDFVQTRLWRASMSSPKWPMPS